MLTTNLRLNVREEVYFDNRTFRFQAITDIDAFLDIRSTGFFAIGYCRFTFERFSAADTFICARCTGLVFLFALMFCGLAAAQRAVSEAVAGTVVDSRGTVLPNAANVVHNAAANAVVTAATEVTGYHVFRLVPGNYTSRSLPPASPITPLRV